MINFTRTILPISSLFSATLFFGIGYGMILTLVSIFMREAGVSDLMIGFINSLFFLGAISATIFAQHVITTIGHIRSFAVFASLMAISFLFHSLFFDIFIWSILRFTSGFSFYAILIVTESWLNEKSHTSNRGKIFAFYTIIFYVAIAIGQLFVNVPQHLMTHVFTIGTILILIAVSIISMTQIKQPHLEIFTPYSFPKLYSVVPLALSGSFSGGFIVGGIFTMIPIVTMILFESVATVSYVMICIIIGGLVAQAPIGILSDKLGRRKLIALSGLGVGLVGIGYLFATQNIVLFYILSFLLGAFSFSLYPLSITRAYDVLDANSDTLEISRTLLFVYGLGSMVAPIVIGVGLGILTQSIFVVFALLGIFLFFYSLSKKRIADDQMSIYVNMPLVSSGFATDLDPREDEESSPTSHH